MAISRERKEELVALYGDLLRGTNGIVVTSYKGLTVAQVGQMRDKLRDIDGKFVITKNTLFAIALREGGWPVPVSCEFLESFWPAAELPDWPPC